MTMILSCLLSISVYAHPGKTDSKGGHHDYNNVSGLGSYHYHHGESAHLHENGICLYEERKTESYSKDYSNHYFYLEEVNTYSSQVANSKTGQTKIQAILTNKNAEFFGFLNQYKWYLISLPCVVVVSKTLICGCRKMRDNKEKIRYCKYCGNKIDNTTKTCTGCGKKFFNLKKLCSKLVIVLCVISVAGNLFLGYQCFDLNAKYKDANHKYVVWKEEYEELKTDYKKYSDMLCTLINRKSNSDVFDVSESYSQYDYYELLMECVKIGSTLPK